MFLNLRVRKVANNKKKTLTYLSFAINIQQVKSVMEAIMLNLSLQLIEGGHKNLKQKLLIISSSSMLGILWQI